MAPFKGGEAQGVKMPKVGVLSVTNLDRTLGYLREGLNERGFREGRNIVIEARSAEGKPELLPRMAAELVDMKVDVIVAVQTPSINAAKLATKAIPIVMTGAGDPVGTGLIASLARPGGNVTGLSSNTAEVAAKHLEIFREMRPSARLVAVLSNVADPFTKTFVEQIRSAARTLGIEVRAVPVRGPEDYDAVFVEWLKTRVDAVLMQPSLPGKSAIELAIKNKMMLAAPNLPLAEAGVLFAYAASPKYLLRKTAIYVDKILKGASPADLPVEQPTGFELFFNLKTAKAIGVVIPRSLLVRADRVIE
jgi:putative ABC transport system substrate-binding protein